MSDLKQKAKTLPEKPGVYLMKDALGHTIYVGKSNCLKNRVSQYFQNTKNHPPKVLDMVGNIRDFDYIETDTELDALLLECRLIQEMSPMYNRKMKNYKAYPYIRITTEETFPAVMMDLEGHKKSGLYFGPYTSRSAVERAVASLKESFPIRKCSHYTSSKSSTGCLNYHMGSCMGCCRGDADKTEYMFALEHIIAFLKGKDKNIIKNLHKKMEEAAYEMDFEKAAKYRDALTGLKHIMNKQQAIYAAEKRKNIVTLEPMDGGRVKFFLIKGSRVLWSEVLDLGVWDLEGLRGYLKGVVLRYFSVKGIGGKTEDVMGRDEIDAVQIIYSYLKGKSKGFLRIPESWLRGRGSEKLDDGLRDILEDVFHSQILPI